MLRGTALWPGIWLGSFAANVTIEGDLLAATVIATGSSLQAYAIATLIGRRIGIPRRFARVREVVLFVGVIALGAIIAPTMALLPLAALHPLPAAELAANWWTWWQGDACGMVVVPGLMRCALLAQLERARVALAKRAEERTRAAAEIERRFRLMVESVVDYAIYILDANGRVASWNAGAERIKGYTADEIIGQPLSRFYLPEDVERGKPERDPDIARRDGRFEEEAWRVRKDGSTFWANVVMSAVRDDEGELIGFAKVSRDLTDTKRVEAEMLRAKIEAERASESKSQFLANMSHELRTPLNSLLILARLLADNAGGRLDAKEVRFAQTIYASGMDLLALINDLLDLAKIEAGAITALHMAPARLEDLRDELERTFREMAREKGLELTIDIAPGLPATIRTDATRVKQVLKNLLANAFKFTRQGSIRLSIAPRAPEYVAFAVSDTGIGIAPDKQKIIFEAFQQADGTTSRQYGGTGLGLSISRELTRLLGGELQVASEPGRGSTFTLILPVTDVRLAARVN